MDRLTLKPTLREYLDQVPPKLVRLLARDMTKKQKALTNLDVAKASGLHAKRVAHISLLDSWDSLTVREIDAFRSACGVTMLNIRWHRAFLRRSMTNRYPLAHLRNRRVKTKFLKKLLTQAASKG